MPTLEIIEKKPINMSDLREELADIKKRDGELSFRGAKTEEYVTEFASLKPKQAEELYAKVEKLNIPRMKDSYINKIIDMLPASVAELKVIMQGYALPVTNENLKKIVDCVAEFIPKKKEEASKQKLAVPEKQSFSDKKEDKKEEASKQKPADKKTEETSKQKLAVPEIQKSKISESKTESFGKQGFSEKKE